LTGLFACLRGLRPWQQVVAISLISMPLTAVLLLGWIGLSIALSRLPGEPVSADAALNLMLVVLIAVVGLPLMQAGQYRWLWHTDRKRQTGQMQAMDPPPRYGSEPSAPPPVIAWPRPLRLRHAAMHVVGATVLIATFARYGNQHAIGHLLDRFSAGPASRGSLASLLFDYVPLAAFAALAILLTHRQMKKRDAGRLDARQSLLLDAELNWLFAFAAAFTIAGLLCRFAGSMIIAYL
jgi:hypothetical protein